jgi:CheY-like chemotaxis protein
MVDVFVLVVDDHPETLAMLTQALELEGIRVRTAGSVLRAVEALHDGSPRPALIVTDLMMPQTTGWDFLKHLRSEPALQALPIIVITGIEPGEGEDLADVVLRKPVDPLHLVKTVRSLLLSSTTPQQDR